MLLFSVVIEYYLSNNERVGHRKSFDLQLIGIRKPGYWHQFSPNNPYVIDINLCLHFYTILFTKGYIPWQTQSFYDKHRVNVRYWYIFFWFSELNWCWAECTFQVLFVGQREYFNFPSGVEKAFLSFVFQLFQIQHKELLPGKRELILLGCFIFGRKVGSQCR